MRGNISVCFLTYEDGGGGVIFFNVGTKEGESYHQGLNFKCFYVETKEDEWQTAV